MIGFLLCVRPALNAMPVGLNLIVALTFCGGAAAAIFCASALLLWQMVGRPDGLETIVVQKVLPRRSGALTS
jgi:hypothetical protein